MTNTIDSLARLQDRDILRVSQRSGVFAHRVWKLAYDAAQRQSTVFNRQLVQAAQSELTDLMVHAYLLRMRLRTARRSLGKSVSKAIEFASVRTLTNRAGRRLNIDAGNLREQFTTLTGRALRRELGAVKEIINRGLASNLRAGLKGDDATRALVAYLRARGLQPRSDAYVKTLVRTHVAIAYGLAHRVAFMGDPDLWGFEYVTVGDDRVRESHALLHGVRRRKGDAFWDSFWPPCGWGCRCQAVPIYGTGIRQTRVPSNAVIDEDFLEMKKILDIMVV